MPPCRWLLHLRRKKERKWIPQRGDRFSRFWPLPRHACTRPRGGASPEGGRVGSRCMQRHCRWRRCCRLRCCRFRDSVAVSCIAACCASLPAEHCRPAAERIIAAALHSCFATMQPALCRLRRPSLTACSRFDSSASWVSQILSVPESQQCQWPRYRRCYASNCQLPESLLRAHCF